MTTTENDVFRKIKEISLRTHQPRPAINTAEIAAELFITSVILLPWLKRLRQLRLVAFNEMEPKTIKLTLLGTVVNR